MERIRVLVADHDPDLREALIELIGKEGSLDLVGVAEDTGEAIELAERHRPEVALVDARMPGGGGARVARELRSRSADTRVIAVSAQEERATLLQLLAAGVAGYLVKGAPPEEILTAIRECVEGHAIFSKGITAALVQEVGDYLRKRDEEWEALLRRSARTHRIIRGEGLTVALQPIVDLGTGQVEGVEALARFTMNPDRGPHEWFEEAEAVGLRVELEQAALARGLAEIDRLPARWFLAVNLSPDAITSEGVARSLRHEQAGRIVVEVTEHARVADYAELLGALDDFRSEGGRLAIDDAGAGFASFRHVVVMLPDIIKLDMSLTRGIDKDRGRRALASAMISFASEIGSTIIAEGIETAEELEALRTLGVGFGQGFYLAQPRRLVPGDDPAEAFPRIPIAGA
ncbi:MAG TPA: EAL domain-containing protein [Actinomycetota bacterium]|jgi:EAL domain-containing protein (putative c-di-GMP-specific phosphodiesterase class I)